MFEEGLTEFEAISDILNDGSTILSMLQQVKH